MKTNNHPANGPLTTERLIHIRDVLQRNLQYSNGGSMDYIIADAVKAIDELLEVRKAEPVAWMVRDIDTGEKVIRPDRSYFEGSCQPLYTAPSAAVVPDEWTIQDAVKFCRETGRQDAGSAMDAWNACRAAMLQGADGNSPVIQNGWVMVPVEPTEAMINAYRGALYSGESAVSCIDLYKAMIAAAPQQEE
ncbi:hypothetical protein MMK47_000270 [Citrobacter koseri]|uniref:hypothetical protein n=1 Tax=Citrobacter koseri TaxID=545 RepID=UPI001F289051|nr:hypothetical protein [Citrobacter koseri]